MRLTEDGSTAENPIPKWILGFPDGQTAQILPPSMPELMSCVKPNATCLFLNPTKHEKHVTFPFTEKQSKFNTFLGTLLFISQHSSSEHLFKKVYKASLPTANSARSRGISYEQPFAFKCNLHVISRILVFEFYEFYICRK